ncbi:MAG TPA: hypothetical protein VHT04_09905 [Stellaceae bacterium]|jgi:hypothetical protein|nr:hypothetical protein [Stellaceae bacterium]
MALPMNHVAAIPEPQRLGPVEPDLLASAIFLFAEYLRRLEQEAPASGDDDDAAEGPQIETRAVLDLLAEELATDVRTTLNLYMRVTALYRLLAGSPSLAKLALDNEEFGGALRDDALVAAARLDVYVQRAGEEGSADFDPREFRAALDAED